MDYKKISKSCSLAWEKNPSLAVKTFFAIKQRDIFQDTMKWLFFNHEETFYKNYSLIVGVPNSQTLAMEKIKGIFNKDLKEHNKLLNEYICKEYQKPFKDNWNDTIIHKFDIPMYGKWEDLIELSKLDSKKLYYTTVTLFANDIDKSYFSKEYTESIFCLENTNIEKGVKERVKDYDKKKEYLKSLKVSTNTKEIPFKNFFEKFVFVTI
jgi:hypothetical protein